MNWIRDSYHHVSFHHEFHRFSREKKSTILWFIVPLVRYTSNQNKSLILFTNRLEKDWKFIAITFTTSRRLISIKMTRWSIHIIRHHIMSIQQTNIQQTTTEQSWTWPFSLVKKKHKNKTREKETEELKKRWMREEIRNVKYDEMKSNSSIRRFQFHWMVGLNYARMMWHMCFSHNRFLVACLFFALFLRVFAHWLCFDLMNNNTLTAERKKWIFIVGGYID